MSAVLPKGTGYITWMNYVSTRLVPRGDRLGDLKGMWAIQNIPLYDDNSGIVIQITGPSTEGVIRAMEKHKVKGAWVHRWMVGDTEPDNYFVARALWEKGLTAERAYRDILGAICGPAAVENAVQGLLKLSEANSWLENRGIVTGFPVPNLMRQNFEAHVSLAEWPLFQEIIDHYEPAMPFLLRARKAATPRGKKFIDYFIGRLECTLGYLRTTQKVISVGYTHKLWKEAMEKKDGLQALARRDELLRQADEAEREARKAIEAFARVVNDQSDRGMLASLNRYVYQYVRSLRLLLELETIHWGL